MPRLYPHVKVKTGFRVSPPIQWKVFLRDWKKYNVTAIKNYEMQTMEYYNIRFLITCIHKSVNTVRYKPDVPGLDIWKIFLSLAADGDCEDYALTKRYLLNQVNIPLGALSPIICLTTRGTPHMVLSIQTKQVTYILDNLIRDIRMINAVPYKYLSMLKGNRWYQVIGN